MPAKVMQPEPDRLGFKAFTNADKKQNKLLKNLVGGAYARTKNYVDMRMGVDAPPQMMMKDQTVEDIAAANATSMMAFDSIKSFQRSALGAIARATGGPAQTGLIGRDIQSFRDQPGGPGRGPGGPGGPGGPPGGGGGGRGLDQFFRGMGPADEFKRPTDLQDVVEALQRGGAAPGGAAAAAFAGMNVPPMGARAPRGPPPPGANIFGAGAAGARMPAFETPIRPNLNLAANEERVRRVMAQQARMAAAAAMGGTEERKEGFEPRTPAQAIPVAEARDAEQGQLGDAGGLGRGVGPANPDDMGQHAANMAPAMPYPAANTQAGTFAAQAQEDGFYGPNLAAQVGADFANSNATFTDANIGNTSQNPMAGGYDAPEYTNSAAAMPSAEGDMFYNGVDMTRMVQFLMRPENRAATMGLITLAEGRFPPGVGTIDKNRASAQLGVSAGMFHHRTFDPSSIVGELGEMAGNTPAPRATAIEAAKKYINLSDLERTEFHNYMKEINPTFTIPVMPGFIPQLGRRVFPGVRDSSEAVIAGRTRLFYERRPEDLITPSVRERAEMAANPQGGQGETPTMAAAQRSQDLASGLAGSRRERMQEMYRQERIATRKRKQEAQRTFYGFGNFFDNVLPPQGDPADDY